MRLLERLEVRNLGMRRVKESRELISALAGLSADELDLRDLER